MRFRIGPVPEDPSFDPPAQGWSPIREPGPIAAQLLAVPVALGLLLALGCSFAVIHPPTGSFWLNVISTGGQATGVSAAQRVWWAAGGLVALAVLLAPLHELAHALCMPGMGRTDRTWIGLWPQKLAFYAHYEGVMSRDLFLAVFLGPLLALSLAPVALAALLGALGCHPGVLLGLSVVSMVNGISSAVDVVGCLLVWRQVPRSAAIRNLGWRTFWRLAHE